LAWKSTCFGQSSVYHQEFIHCTLSIGICLQWHIPLRLSRTRMELHPGSARKPSTMTYTIAFEQDQVPSWSCLKAVYKPVWHIPLLSVQRINSWWRTDEPSKTCRVSCQNKFVKLVHLVAFIIKKFVTMHGHMNIKFCQPLLYL
jgi:hypothetical protein